MTAEMGARLDALARSQQETRAVVGRLEAATDRLDAKLLALLSRFSATDNGTVGA
jgi:hypothetical protein